ncbi:DUF6328 family protein [Pseudonocardia eucalypti]|uniref:DUF6328 family protein n=1 Tax=Pseudonocardia eucalypti TaxID=648755 RepID=A0ABP9PVE4_9PSEU|nr:hypothetical protein [Pseudonocardia eucalypti]
MTRNESTLQRADRNFGELLQELRVAQTGVQILFAFLLSLSFMERFEHVTPFQRDVYVITLVSCAVTTALLIAPVAAHRLQFQVGLKVQLVRMVHWCVLAGLGALLFTVAGALLLVLDVVIGAPIAETIAAFVACFFLFMWFALPAMLRFAGRRNSDR